MSRRISWPAVLEKAAAIVKSYDSGVTLRQLFYRLVSELLIPNTQTAYKTLSNRSARARRERSFPGLIDRTRSIWQLPSFGSTSEAKSWLRQIYRRDRTEGQPWLIFIAVEKNALATQLETWLGDLGLPILALGGYTSQTAVDDVVHLVRDDGRPAALIYGGDYDPSGEDILRDFVERTQGVFEEVRRVALTWDQVEQYGLPPMPGKKTDSRAAAFEARHGRLVQVELDALDPSDLKQLYREGIAEFWDKSAFEASLAAEEREREELA